MIRPYPVPLIDEEAEPMDPFELWPDLPRRDEEELEGLGIWKLLERADRRVLRRSRGRGRRPAA
jgi:hypothetical protein